MNVGLTRRWLLKVPESERSQSQAFTRGKAQTADQDDQEDPASETRSACVFNRDHLIGAALESFVISTVGNIATVNSNVFNVLLFVS